jgi:nucleoside triphosphate pyrophosphatase
MSGPAAPPRTLLLASASPRRAELLRMLGLEFSTVATSIDETPGAGEAPAVVAPRLARAKALAVPPPPGRTLVIAADTIVVIDGAILGKPADEAEARRFVARLAGATHEVITSIAVRACPEESIACESSVSRVTFAPLSAEEIAWYAGTGEGRDKAGAYALQGIGALFITAIEGSYTNVIGLPLDRLYPHLVRWGFLGPAPRR